MAPETALESLLTPVAVAELAGPRSYARGIGYHDDGRVELGVVASARAEATVRGTMPYRVALWVDRSSVGWSCSCPMGDAGEFCKHCVAVALTVLEDDAATGPEILPVDGRSADAGRAGADADAEMRRFVGSLEAEELAEIVLRQADEDWRLRERLMIRASAAGGKGIDVRLWRRRIESAFAPDDGFVDYREAPGWAAGVFDVIDALEDRVEVGQADAVIRLTEHAHRLADAAIQYVDDSDGCLTDISGRLGELHLWACELGPPEPVELARRLVNLELTSELDAFHRAAATYVDVLGADGLEEYRRLVEPRFQKLQPDSDPWSHDGFSVREAMIGVAMAGGDPDDLIRVKLHDLRTPDDYLEVAESLRSSGRLDDAVDWARRGLEAYASRSWQTPPLREFLARILRDRGDMDGAIETFWQAFGAHPSVETYRRLLTEAEPVGQHDDWRQRAITGLRDRVAERHPEDADTRSIVTMTPAAELIEILLYEGDVEGAWETAATHGCSDRLWLTLARAREDDHPLDVIPVYEREAWAQIETKKKRGYRNAVEHLARIHRAAERAGEPDRFDRVLAEVRSAHKLKRNLMALFDERGW